VAQLKVLALPVKRAQNPFVLILKVSALRIRV